MDLNAPLGRKPPPRRRVMPIVLMALAALVAVGLGVLLIRADPHGGEPTAVALIPPPPTPKPPPAPAVDMAPTGSIAPQAATPDADTTTIENGVRVVTPSTGERVAPRTAPLVIDVTKALDHGGLKRPEVGVSGIRALPGAATGAPRPRVAIFVGGLGLGAAATRAAIETMPPAVDLAFVPYGATLAASVDAARAKGHEVLLQLPMQGAGGATLGPHSLKLGEPSAETAADLAWLTSRFQGYAGVTNLLGASVTADPGAMTAVLKAVAARGAFYVDDGTSRRSIAASLSGGLGVPVVQADVVLDATADPAVVTANLERLAALARAKGTAVGMASGLSDHLAAVARFAAALDARGLALVPVSAIARGPANVATTTR